MATWIQFFTLLVLIGTAFIVWRYTIAAQEANKIQVRPLLNLYLEGYGFDFRLQNDGRGPAYNIIIKDIEVHGYITKLELRTPNILLIPGESTTLRVYAQTPSGGVEVPDTATFLRRISPETLADRETLEKAKKGVVLHVLYKGTDGGQHNSSFRLYDTAPPAHSFAVEFIEYQ